MHRETDQPDIEAYALVGMDCAVNCHLGLINVDRTAPRYDEGSIASSTTSSSSQSSPLLPHRSQHATAGSMTAYHRSDTITTRDIPAGAELFKPTLGDIPLRDDYVQAIKLLHNIQKLYNHYNKLLKQMTECRSEKK